MNGGEHPRYFAPSPLAGDQWCKGLPDEGLAIVDLGIAASMRLALATILKLQSLSCLSSRARSCSVNCLSLYFPGCRKHVNMLQRGEFWRLCCI